MTALGLRSWLSLTALLLFFSLLFTLNAQAAQITAAPAQGVAGTTVTVTGTGWPPGDLIEFSWNFNYPLTVGNVHANSAGAFTTTVAVPTGAPIGATYIDAGDQASFLTAQAAFTVTSGQTGSGPRLTTDCAHLTVPWVALYQNVNFGGRELCFEGTGLANLADYEFDKQTQSINIAASGVFFDQSGGRGNQVAFYPGERQATLATWNRRISSFEVDPPNTIRCPGANFIFPVKVGYIGWLYEESTDGIDPSGLHSGLDFWAGTNAPVMAVATGYVSRPLGFSMLQRAYNIDIYYPSMGVETYTDNIINPQVKVNSAVTAGTLIGYEGSYGDHVHWSVGTKGYNDQDANWGPTTPHLDPTSYLTPGGNLNYASGAREDRSASLSSWCTRK